MPLSVILAAVAVAISVPILIGVVASGRTTTSRVGRNLGVDTPVTNLRQIVLTRSAADRALRPMAYAVARRARRVTPAGVLEAMERRLELAGDTRPVDRLLLMKVIAGLALGGIGLWFFFRNPQPATAALAVVLLLAGYTAPDASLARRARARQTEIRRELPDVLDQLSVCTEAGLGFDASLNRVARTGRGPLATEISRALQDIQLGMPRHDAFRNLVERNDVVELRQFINAVMQAETYGVPTANVLRTQSVEQRERRRFRAEERAQKIPVKLVFPLVLCILPTLMLVVLGPGLIQAIENL